MSCMNNSIKTLDWSITNSQNFCKEENINIKNERDIKINELKYVLVFGIKHKFWNKIALFHNIAETREQY